MRMSRSLRWPRRPSTGTGRGVTAVVLLGLVAGLTPAAGVPAHAAARNTPTPLPQERPVQGTARKVLPKPADPASAALGAKAGSKSKGSSKAKVSWPVAGTATVSPVAADTAPAQPKRTSVLAPGVHAGGLPVWVRANSGSVTPGSVRISVLDQSAAARAGVSGLLLTARDADAASSGPAPGAGPAGTSNAAKTAATEVSVSVDYSGFRDAYGGDWAQRLHLVRLPACAVTTPTVLACRKQTPLASTNDPKTQRVSALVPLASANPASSATVLAATAGSSGSTGDYTATSLTPAGSWSVAAQSGDFAWTYQMRVPHVPGDLIPTVSADYSSGSVDGETAATNNQPSWVGDGWNLWPGFVERSLRLVRRRHCRRQPEDRRRVLGHRQRHALAGRQELRADQGRSHRHLASERRQRVQGRAPDRRGQRRERRRVLAGHHDRRHPVLLRSEPPARLAVGRSGDPVCLDRPGVRQRRGEPCHGSTFAASWCQQAWRWNLDYVVDRHGNTITYYYQPETNSYGLNIGATTVSYTRGGNLLRAEYGTRQGQEYSGQAPARVLFNTADRCAPGTDCAQHNATSFPDVPWDQNCSSACTTKYSPSFWSTKRLRLVETQVLSGSAYQRRGYLDASTRPIPTRATERPRRCGCTASRTSATSAAASPCRRRPSTAPPSPTGSTRPATACRRWTSPGSAASRTRPAARSPSTTTRPTARPARCRLRTPTPQRCFPVVLGTYRAPGR